MQKTVSFRTIRHLCAALVAIVAFAPQGTRAAWSYDSVAGTITDGNWKLNVTAVTVDGVPGLGITGRKNSTGSGDLDLTTFATNVGQPVVSVGGLGHTSSSLNWLSSFVGPNVLAIGASGLRYQKSLTNVVLSAAVSTLGATAFNETGAIKSFYPTTFPNVTYMDGVFSVSTIPGDLVFPNVTTLLNSAARGGGLTSFTAPKCRTISIFEDSSSLTNVVFDWPATSIAGTGFKNCRKLVSEIYLAGDAITTIPKYAFQFCDSIKGVHIDCPNLELLEWESFFYAPKLPIYWYSANCPVLGVRALGGSASSTFSIAHLPRIHLMRGEAIAAWAGSYTPIADVSNDSKTGTGRSDFPGVKTLGLLYDATLNNVAWIVDGTPNAALYVASAPGNIGAPSPAFGGNHGHAATNAVADASGATTIHFNSAIYSSTGHAVETSSDKGATWNAPAVTNAGAVYAYPADGFYRVTWLWDPVAYQFTLATDGTGGSVSAPPEDYAGGYYAANSTVTLTANPPAGLKFKRWEGTISPEQAHDNPLHIVADAPKTLKACFADGWTLLSSNTILSNNTWVLNVASATGGDLSSLSVTGVRASPPAASDLDLGQVERDTGYKVIQVGDNAFNSNLKLLSFIGPDVVKSGNLAFNSCSITNATLSPAFQSFGGSDFDNCKSVKSFWPSTLTNLATMAFGVFCNSTMAGDFVLPIATKIEGSAFKSSSITSVIAPNCTNVGSQAMWVCKALHTVVLSDNVETLGSYVFDSDTALANFHPKTMPKLTAMPANAFNACSKLSGDFVLPIATSIGNTAFTSTQIDSIVATNCTSVGVDAFRYCNYTLHGLTNAVFSSGISYIGNAAFDMSQKLVSFFPTNMPGITSLGSIFCSCGGALKLAFLFPNLTTFNGSTFQGCSGIPFVSAPKCTYLGGNTFNGCSGLKGVELPGLEYVGNNAFQTCSSLTNEIVLVGSALTTLSQYAFQRCNMLAGITVKAPNIASIGTEALCYCAAVPIHWYAAVKPSIAFSTRAIAGGSNATTATPYPRVYAMTTPAAMGWAQYYTPVSQLTDTQKNRSDYPGKRTLGLVSIGPADTGSVFWIIDGREHTATTLLLR